mgnify:CR=1 FL=1
MGRQVGFYMMPNDEREFIEFVTINSNSVIYPSVSKDKQPKPFKSLPNKYEYNWWFFIYCQGVKGLLKYDYIKKQNHYHIDDMRSYIIEFSRCGPKEDLRNGRLWAEIMYWDKDKQGNSIIVRKSPEFVKWFNKITNWIRRNYECRDGLYFSKKVIEYLKIGGKVSVSGHKVGWDVISKWKK